MQCLGRSIRQKDKGISEISFLMRFSERDEKERGRSCGTKYRVDGNWKSRFYTQFPYNSTYSKAGPLIQESF